MGSEEASSSTTKKNRLQKVGSWVKRRSTKAKATLGALVGVVALVLLWLFVKDHSYIFMAAESSHAIGISVLIWKLVRNRTCAGLSLKSQQLTAMFLAVRMFCSVAMEFDIHTVLDSATLIATLWVVYMIRFKVRSSYMENNDNFAMYYLIIACAVIALVVHPSTEHSLLHRFLWAFSVYMEAVSVLPQLQLMQNAKIVEPFTAHYVFALGVARFLNCAHWILQNVNTRGYILTILGYGLWPCMVILAEIVQTFILADFCYYYVRSVVEGDLILRLSSGKN